MFSKVESPIRIGSKNQLEKAALHFGVLPFFANRIPGFSVEELTLPGMLFGGNEDYGCWEWKGPVIQEQTTAYGKFFNRKAGFVSLDLLPAFLNYRRKAYPVIPGTTDDMLLEIIRNYEGLSSTELKALVYGNSASNRKPEDPVDIFSPVKSKRKSLESPLQRLQMGGQILIANFEYKYTRKGDRYGWGVAVYSTPEIWFERKFQIDSKTSDESLDDLTEIVAKRIKGIPMLSLRNLLK